MHKDTIDSNVSNSLTCESLSEDVQCGLQQILFVNFHTYTCTVQTYKFSDHSVITPCSDDKLQDVDIGSLTCIPVVMRMYAT